MSNLATLVPAQTLDAFVRTIRNHSTLTRLAGAQVIETEGAPVHVPVVDVENATAGYVAALQPIPVADTTSTEIVLLPAGLKAMKMLEVISNEALSGMNSSVPLESALTARMVNMLDRELVAGNGPSGVEIVGLLTKAGVHDDDEGPLTHERLIDARAEIETYQGVPRYALGHPKVIASLLKAREDGHTGSFLVPPGSIASPGADGAVPTLSGLGLVSTPAMPYDAQAGTGDVLLVDPASLLIALERTPDMLEKSEHAAFDRDGVAIRVAFRADIGVLHPKHVVRISVTTEA